MAISVICPECGYRFSVRDEYAGRRGRCPQCQGVFTAEPADAVDEFPSIAAGGVRRTNGSSRHGASLGHFAASGPAVASTATTSVASAYAARRRKASVPVWGWAAIGAALLLAAGAIGGAWALSPDPQDVKKTVQERTAKADKEYAKIRKELLEQVDEVIDKLPGVEADIKEFARPKTVDTDVIPGIVKVFNLVGGMQRGHGTGWIANDQHWIVTNHHVVEGCESLYVMTADGKKHDIEGIIVDKKEWDLAILKPTKPIEGGKPLKIAPNDGSHVPSAGDEVWAAGNPATHTFAISRGIICRRVTQKQLISEASQMDTAFYTDPERDIVWIEHDARIFPGNSGGPLLDEHFRVIGVNTLGIMVNLQREIERAREDARKKKGDKRGPRDTPTFALASNSMYVLELLELYKEGKVQPFSSISSGL